MGRKAPRLNPIDSDSQEPLHVNTMPRESDLITPLEVSLQIGHRRRNFRNMPLDKKAKPNAFSKHFNVIQSGGLRRLPMGHNAVPTRPPTKWLTSRGKWYQSELWFAFANTTCIGRVNMRN